MNHVEWKEMPDQCRGFADGWLLKLRDGHAFIISNGSKWAGERPDKLGPLFKTLRDYKAESGPFFTARPEWGGSVQPPGGAAHFFGNFEDVSHVFDVYTDSPRLIKSLRSRVMSSKRREGVTA